MTSIVIFTISGMIVFLLPLAKRLESKQGKSFLIFRLISKGDFYVREIYHWMVHLYFEGKERSSFLIKRQIPLHSKNFSNKLTVYLREKRIRYFNNMRDSRLLKKSDGISEFFKNMSNLEKGNGEINDVYYDGSQNSKKELD
ncbi:MAG: hypothetical protein A3C62_02510 [Candidatus Zambryskibacteria bacterium RIFCSPHIGHO2_02_FULL_39_16]|uniref:Uncharacterized protein n=1 Tax=Candidatus Zambryskibacteria bacterium RIFCSPLOWO2_02_FULL_39_14 TaxID=1802769 RepID=A0A1G2UI87_9BACT|nr:MAG: hypothetical protein UT62_C0011G0009 [Parcubacteria group bacterium GW2011_GWC1_39_8]OHA95427.1 MAG: hypothetical protein A3C62_02510 [Candidatus Zambryskibacteria bacterium RIFCSPHIGHO2_02_FULL_39_16]OHB09159.1 MAG: hypothetical protein A3I86_01785 [Candidatus Zambryskibacteria bacterium RIFCSPLOWO2_02_FULL_39_14]